MGNRLRIALIGNPNTGKSSLFNALTGLRQKVGNFPGITVDKSTGHFNLPGGSWAELTDLPGTYSLFPKSPDEVIPYDSLLSTDESKRPELVLFIADAGNLKRQLVLLTQILDLQLPVILCLNMKDHAEARGIKIDTACLAQKLDLPVVLMNARKKEGIKELLAQIEKGGALPSRSFMKGGQAMQPHFESLAEQMGEPTVYQAVLKLHRFATLGIAANKQTQQLENFRKQHKIDLGIFQREDIVHRNRELEALLRLCLSEESDTPFRRRQAAMDKVLSHPLWGYVIFFGILFLIFQAIFRLAQYPMDWIAGGLALVSDGVNNIMPQGILRELLTNGILAGLSGVLVFIPQIAFLFFFIAIMEDTGYLARVAFLMDRTMRRFGLNGKSVIPLISGTACAVPAIMAARNIENSRSRLITILVTPLMSCSARLPVYILLIGIALPDKHIWGFLSLQGLALMGMYVLGFVAALGAAAAFKWVMRSKVKQYFILEMPPYRLPGASNVGLAVYKKVKAFVTEAGKIIIAISIVLWFLASFGPPGKFKAIDDKYAATANEVTTKQLIRTEKLQESYAGMLGKAIEPAIRPLGFDWKIGIAIISSFAAREVFVGTMATLYGMEGDNPNYKQLKTNMLKARDPVTGNRIYDLATVLSLMIFYAFAMQCMSTLAVTYKETASLKWTLIQLGFMSGLAYFASLLVYQLLI